MTPLGTTTTDGHTIDSLIRLMGELTEDINNEHYQKLAIMRFLFINGYPDPSDGEWVLILPAKYRFKVIDEWKDRIFFDAALPTQQGGDGEIVGGVHP